MRYSDVEPLFNNHCARCHTQAYGSNDGAQKVFESTSYPFTTAEPPLVRHGAPMPRRLRRGIDDAERCIALTWWYQGALDNDGNPPPWPTK